MPGLWLPASASSNHFDPTRLRWWPICRHSQLPAFAPSRHETAARGVRYCGLWESIMPTVGRPDAFHREHTVIRQQGHWLAGGAIGVSYRWGLNGFMTNGKLIL